MPAKRVKTKKKLTINYDNLTDDLYEAITRKVSLGELMGDYSRMGIKSGYNFLMFNKDDIDVCKEIWSRHKNEVMARWKEERHTAGTRPFLWWKVQGLKKPRADRQKEETEYLSQNRLLEPWELDELARRGIDKSLPED